MPYVESCSPDAYCVTSACHHSLPQRERQFYLGLLVGVLALLAAVALSIGAWPVLPFFGLELAVIWAVLRYLDRHAGDFDRLTIRGEKLLIERRDSNRSDTTEFNRYWTQVILQCGQGGNRCRLAMRAHGQEVEFGRFLNDEERMKLARELRQHTGFV
jgi:uncharacterized membrane protein